MGRGPHLGRDVISRIEDLRAEGHRAPTIHRLLQQELGEAAPANQRTVERYVLRSKMAGDDGRIPVTLSWMVGQGFSEGQLETLGATIRPGVPPVRRAEARWFLALRAAFPSVGEDLARWFAENYAAAARDSAANPEFAHLDLGLAIRPWESRAAWQDWQTKVTWGLIPGKYANHYDRVRQIRIIAGLAPDPDLEAAVDQTLWGEGASRDGPSNVDIFTGAFNVGEILSKAGLHEDAGGSNIRES